MKRIRIIALLSLPVLLLTTVVIYEEYQPRHHLFQSRYFHAAVLLKSGEVLIIGGQSATKPLIDVSGYSCADYLKTFSKFLFIGDHSNLASCDLFDPKTGTLRATGPLTLPRGAPQAVRLSDGRVLVADLCEDDSPTCEIYDRGSETWSKTGSLHSAGKFLLTLADGRVMAADSGESNSESSGNAVKREMYSPALGTWSQLPDWKMSMDYCPILLSDGRVFLVASKEDDERGGNALYDPASGNITDIPKMGGPAVALSDGRVFINEGDGGNGGIFDPKTGHYADRPYRPGQAYQTLTLLADGRILAAGGASADCELFDPTTNTWKLTGSLHHVRWFATATRLLDGRVLLVGGADQLEDNGTTLSSIEIYDPATGMWKLQ